MYCNMITNKVLANTAIIPHNYFFCGENNEDLVSSNFEVYNTVLLIQDKGGN